MCNYRLCSFGGWDMPLQYKDGIAKEHLHCRAEVCHIFSFLSYHTINIPETFRPAYSMSHTWLASLFLVQKGIFAKNFVCVKS